VSVSSNGYEYRGRQFGSLSQIAREITGTRWSGSTLREVCGLTTEKIAKVFLTTPRTLAQRIVRAKAKIRDRPIRYEELPERLDAVHLHTLVLESGLGLIAICQIETCGHQEHGEDNRNCQAANECLGQGSIRLTSFSQF
jgi:predicted RNA polymerase sigma factor